MFDLNFLPRAAGSVVNLVRSVIIAISLLTLFAADVLAGGYVLNNILADTIPYLGFVISIGQFAPQAFMWVRIKQVAPRFAKNAGVDTNLGIGDIVEIIVYGTIKGTKIEDNTLTFLRILTMTDTFIDMMSVLGLLRYSQISGFFGGAFGTIKGEIFGLGISGLLIGFFSFLTMAGAMMLTFFATFFGEPLIDEMKEWATESAVRFKEVSGISSSYFRRDPPPPPASVPRYEQNKDRGQGGYNRATSLPSQRPTSSPVGSAMLGRIRAEPVYHNIGGPEDSEDGVA